MGIVMKDSLWKEKGIATDMRDQCSHKLYNSILYCFFFIGNCIEISQLTLILSH